MAGRGGGLKTRQLKFHPRAGELTKPKGYKSAISEIATDTFNTGQNKFAAQFTQSRKNVANYLQRTSANEGYLVVETVRLSLPAPKLTLSVPDPSVI